MFCTCQRGVAAVDAGLLEQVGAGSGRRQHRLQPPVQLPRAPCSTGVRHRSQRYSQGLLAGNIRCTTFATAIVEASVAPT